MHVYFVNRFEASDGLGGVRTMGPLMALDDAMTVSVNAPWDEGARPTPRAYRVQAFELIGVAKRATPVAFVIRKHSGNIVTVAPGPLAPAGLQARPLTTFERGALGRLQKGEDVVLQPEGKSLSVVGAVRAKDFCVACHAGYAKGDVLGALSYHLTLIEGK